MLFFGTYWIDNEFVFRDVKSVEKYSPGFTGNPRSIEDVKKFLLSYFLSSKRYLSIFLVFDCSVFSHVLCDNSRFSERALYHHFTVAVDTNNIRTVFLDVKDSILKKNLDALLLQ